MVRAEVARSGNIRANRDFPVEDIFMTNGAHVVAANVRVKSNVYIEGASLSAAADDKILTTDDQAVVHLRQGPGVDGVLPKLQLGLIGIEY
jgi:hypothetical protein